MEYPTEQLSPQDAIQAALSGMRFHRNLPPEVTAAVDAGIVDAGDDQWMRSDDPQQTNYLVLTPAGRRLAVNLGMIHEEAQEMPLQRNKEPSPSPTDMASKAPATAM